jgi:multiple sugar transport system substrate-binding protein
MLVVFCAVGYALASEKGKLHIYFMNPSDPHVKQAEAVIDKFEKAHQGTEVNLEVLGFTGFMAKMAASVASGNPPDIFFATAGHKWTVQQKGWLYPVDDVIEKLGGDDYFEPLPGYTQIDGHYWGVPQQSYTVHLEYRKDLFDQKGLKEPKTWQDLLTAAKALTEDLDGDGKIDRYGIAAPLKTDYLVGIYFLSFLWGNGGHVLDKEGNVVFNSPETVQTLEFFKELYKYAPPGVTGYSWTEMVSTYVQDKAAITTFSALKPLAEAIKANQMIAENTAICPIPTRLASQQGKGRWADMEWMVVKGGKNPELAKEFITFWLQPQRLVKYYLAEPVFVVPGEKPVLALDEYWNDDQIVKYRHVIEKMIELNRGGVDAALEHPGVLQPNTSIINQRLLITECVQNVVLGKLSPEKAAEKAHQEMEKLLAKLTKEK